MDVASKPPSTADREVNRRSHRDAMPGRGTGDHGKFVRVLVDIVEEGACAFAVEVVTPRQAIALGEASLHAKLERLISILHTRHEGLRKSAVLRIGL